MHYSTKVNLQDSQATPEATTWGINGREGRSGVAGPSTLTPSLPGFDISPRGGDSAATPYLDRGDNPHAKVSTWLGSTCGDESRWFIPGTCDNGHRIAKQIVCGKEWCPVCGQKASMAHNRRYVRWLVKVRKLKVMRYWVFTIPEDIRDRYRSADELRKLGKAAQKLLVRQGMTRGLRRWHWFGDNSHKWHPHLNIFTDGGFVDPEMLERVKQGWRDVLGVDTVDINVTYAKTPATIVKHLMYVTRATFKEWEWDVDMALELRGFRNMVVWGLKQWRDAPKWDTKPFTRIDRETGEPADVDAIENIVNGECHVCRAHIEWSKPLPMQLLELVEKRSLGAGYYALDDMPPSRPLPESLAMTFRRRLTEENTKKRHAWRHEVLARAFAGDKTAIELLPADLRRQVFTAMANDAQEKAE